MQETEKLREEGASQLLPEEGVRGGVEVARKDVSIFFSFVFFLKPGFYLYNLSQAASVWKNRIIIFLLKTQPRLRNNPVQTNSRGG